MIHYIVIKDEDPKQYLKLSQQDGEWHWTENIDDVWVFYDDEKDWALRLACKHLGKVEEVQAYKIEKVAK